MSDNLSKPAQVKLFRHASGQAKKWGVSKTPHTEATEAISLLSDSVGERAGCILSGRNQVKVLAATQSERWRLGDELWHSFGGHRMRYLRLTPEHAKSRLAEAPGLTPQQAKSRLAGDPGQGPAAKLHPPRLPLVLIHGLLGYSFSWRHNLEVLAQEREIYAVDLLGIGYSDRPRPAPARATGAVDFGLHATAERMLEWLEALGLRNVDLLGTSHGGAAALMMAALEREHGSGTAVGRLVLAAPANPWSHLGAGRIAFLGSSLGRWMLGSTARFKRLRRAARSLALSRMYGDRTKITVETLDGYGRMMDLPGTIEYALEVVRSWNQDMRELQSRFHVLANLPTLLLWGSRDRAVAPESAYELAANLRNARLIVMNGIGHMPYEEAPEEFNRLVLDFLDGGDSPAEPGESMSSTYSQPPGRSAKVGSSPDA